MSTVYHLNLVSGLLQRPGKRTEGTVMDPTELDAIQAYWDYQKNDRPPGHIGMSGLGHCGRQLGYVFHEIEGAPLDWRAKIIFDDGHLHHDQIRKALREGLSLQNSCYSLIREEEEVTLGIVKGHVDGVLEHDNVKCQKDGHFSKLLEVKSMNDRGFAELKRTGELSKEYAVQTSAYLRASGLRSAVILAKSKNTGEMLRLEYDCDEALLNERLKILHTVLASEDPEQVAREYQPNHDGALPWNCGYCPYVQLCWRDNGVIRKAPHKYELLTKFVVDLHNLSTKDVKKKKS